MDEWSARCRDLYLTKHNNLPVGYEPTVSGKRPQTYALDRTATQTGYTVIIPFKNGCLQKPCPIEDVYENIRTDSLSGLIQ